MTGYYVLAGISVAWALLLTAVGLTQQSFPPGRSMARALMGFSVALAAVTVVVLVSVTHVEHPREEAAEAAAEAKHANGVEEAPAGQQAPAEKPAPAGGGAAKPVPVKEAEFSIAIQGGNSLKAGAYDFQVANDGKIEHDLAIEDGGQEKKTPLIKAGGKAGVKVVLKPGKYRFYCTVPGHAQSGMQENVTVR